MAKVIKNATLNQSSNCVFLGLFNNFYFYFLMIYEYGYKMIKNT